MLPCVLLATSFFAVPLETPFGVWGQFVGLPTHSASGWQSPYAAVFHWGDPSFVRSVQLPPRDAGGPFAPLPLLEDLMRTLPAPVPTHDPTAERIRVTESLIRELKARGGSTAVLEQLQHDLNELKTPPKMPK